MKMATDPLGRALGSLPWRSLLTASLVAALAACGPSDPSASFLAEQLEQTGVQQQEAVTWTLGASYDSTKANITFRVYSARATRLEVWLYKTPYGAQEVVKYVMTKDTATNIWSKTVAVSTLQTTYGITGPVYYGYRAWGPNWPYNSSWAKGTATGFISDVDASGNRFNPNKLLLDPYALEISHDPSNANSTDGTVFGSGPLYRNLDSGARAPKGVVLAGDTQSIGTKPTRALKDDVIYEVHVRGLTKNDTSITAAYRGTYKGAGLKAASLAALGVTAVEFLPVQETENDANDNVASTAGDNYWGYMTLNYFAPDRRYAYDKSAGGPTREFKEMVKAFHDNGIKVFVDVVYNHTGEGGAWNGNDSSTFNVYTFRGLDNPTYYSLTADKQFSWDNTGVGGNFNTFNPKAQDLIIHSLAYWKDTLGVDGFRFDLASVLGNTCEHGCFNYDKLNSGTALNRILNTLTPRAAAGGVGTDFIAEPWAIGGNSYQVGNFPGAWSEWNGIFRDTLRKDQNQMGMETVTPSQLATRFAGSSDLYGDDGRKPFNSINFMVAHDGLSLDDLYSCNSKNNNQAWPYGPSDGGEDNNHSWDQGGIAADQRKAARNGFAFLMLSAGTPMFTGGDEFLRTQYCNNNVYNLDSDKNWLNYVLTTDQTSFKTFAQRLIAFRKAHPALRPLNFYSAVDNNGNVMEQHRWFKPDGLVPDSAYFNNGGNHALAFRVDGTEFGDPASAIYVAYNGWSGNVDFKLPWPGTGKSWYRVTDTCNWAEGASQVASPGAETLLGGENYVYGVCGRGVLLLIAK
ncbi:isoamylase [Hyalangium rubrum]|uniref:Isoamylase n=1 Tax=Hyalangium rubrum TaxID=3103134 RepID=A0ABU5HA96_9BACT|nr:isoamylase [Hyalangium sp. s54d21]MDY7230404.1 isoamylase [Hyalangium sp. s54d21]